MERTFFFDQEEIVDKSLVETSRINNERPVSGKYDLKVRLTFRFYINAIQEYRRLYLTTMFYPYLIIFPNAKLLTFHPHHSILYLRLYSQLAFSSGPSGRYSVFGDLTAF